MTFLLSNSISFLKCFKKYAINTPLRVAHFLAQLHEESGGYTRFSENLNYHADKLTSIFPKRITVMQAQKYGRTNSQVANQKMIASIVYANRYGNGSIASGDGWKYRGRGLMQLTFKGNYQAYKDYSGVDVVNNPDLASKVSVAIDIAGWYWSIYSKQNKFSLNGLNQIADRNDITTITKVVNGGYNNLDERKKQLSDYKKIDTLAILKKKIKPIRSKSLYSSNPYAFWNGLSTFKN